MPGSGIPFYPRELTPQMDGTGRDYFPFVCPTTDAIAFQVGVTGSVSSVSLRRYSAGVSSSIALTTTNVVFGAFTFISFDGVGYAFPDIGLFYYRIVAGGITYESEVFEVGAVSTTEEPCAENATNSDTIEIKWKDTKRWVSGAYYDGGFENRVWVRTQMSRAKFNYEEEVIVDGFGKKLPVLQVSEDVYSFDALSTDGMMLMFQRIAHHDTIKIRSNLNDTYSDVHSVRVVDTGEKSDVLGVCEVSFKLGEPVESVTYEFDSF